MTTDQLTDEVWRAREALHKSRQKPFRRAARQGMRDAERELAARRGNDIKHRQKGTKR